MHTVPTQKEGKKRTNVKYLLKISVRNVYEKGKLRNTIALFIM